MKPAHIPITVFTGFLGAGKTSIILSLLPQLPSGYKVVLLKNEFGDVEVDSKLAQHSTLTAVSEILNGCMCCVLVGQMQTALLEIRDKFNPDRIIIECSGSAFPATLAFQIRQLERDTNSGLKLDAIITVIDAENFRGYEDTSPTAKMQASYTDILLINKWEYVSERELDLLIDDLNTLNDLTPKLRCNRRTGVSPDLIFGLGTRLFQLENKEDGAANLYSHNDEVETLTIYKRRKALGTEKDAAQHSHDSCDGNCHCTSLSEPIRPGGHEDATNASTLPADKVMGIAEDLLIRALAGLAKESVWRVKGFVRMISSDGQCRRYILNWSFGRWEFYSYSEEELQEEVFRFTVMGERGEVKSAIQTFCRAIDAEIR